MKRLGLLLLGLALAEVAVRVLPIEAFRREPLSIDPETTRFAPHPYLAYVPRAGWSTGTPGSGRWTSHNALGFRGPEIARDKPAGTYRIVCLGGSSTYGHGPSGNDATWPARLEQQLDGRFKGRPEIEVVNAGASGYGSYESLGNLAFRVLALDPDLVLVYHGINDARCWQAPGIVPDNTHFRAVWPVFEVGPLTRLLEHSRLFLLARYHLTDYWKTLQLETWVIRDYHERVADRVKQIPPQGPVCFARNLEGLVALCRQHGVDVAFGTQACFWDDLDNAADRRFVERALLVVKEVARDRQVPLAGIAEQMPLERRYFTNDVHVTDAGATALATLWARFIVEQGFVDGG